MSYRNVHLQVLKTGIRVTTPPETYTADKNRGKTI